MCCCNLKYRRGRASRNALPGRAWERENSVCAGMIEETAVPFPYARLIVGTRHCRVLISGSINSDATGMELNQQIPGL